MVGIWLCHIPTLHHYDRFPPGGNVTGGNLLVGHDDDADGDDYGKLTNALSVVLGNYNQNDDDGIIG